MRKEVKLGMAIGGGLIALLVAYLLVAPPSNKKGTQLASGGAGAGSIIEGGAPGDLIPGNGSGADDKSAANPKNTGDGATSTGGTPFGTVPKIQDAKPSTPTPPAT